MGQEEETTSSENTFDYYTVLGVSHNATQQEIRASYKKLVFQYHPDKNREKPKEEQERLNEQFQKIQRAYETLSDEEKRKIYDEIYKFDFLGEELLEVLIWVGSSIGVMLLVILVQGLVIFIQFAIIGCCCIKVCCCSNKSTSKNVSEPSSDDHQKKKKHKTQ